MGAVSHIAALLSDKGDPSESVELIFSVAKLRSSRDMSLLHWLSLLSDRGIPGTSLYCAIV